MNNDLIIAATFIVVYTLSYSFYRRNIIDKRTHIKVWNIIFLMVFLLTISMGLLLTIVQDLGIRIPLSADINVYHMEVGLAFFIVLIFHLSTNWSSFKKLLTNAS